MSAESQRNYLVRDCPKCGREGMANATKCGYCWTTLTPLDANSPLVRRCVDSSRLYGKDNSTSPEMTQYLTAPRRRCPKCGHEGMADATVCGYCWTKLVPIKPLDLQNRKAS